MALTIKIDSREQLPYEFPDYHVEVAGLPVGDYSICGLEDHISVERKELGDLINCLSHDRARFERELYKSRAMDYFALIVEASLSDIANSKYRSDMLPKSAIQSLVAFSIRYRLPVWFAGSRENGQRITESLLCKFAREVEKKHSLLEAS